jgi:hypothetical protein
MSSSSDFFLRFTLHVLDFTFYASRFTLSVSDQPSAVSRKGEAKGTEILSPRVIVGL